MSARISGSTATRRRAAPSKVAERAPNRVVRALRVFPGVRGEPGCGLRRLVGVERRNDEGQPVLGDEQHAGALVGERREAELVAEVVGRCERDEVDVAVGHRRAEMLDAVVAHGRQLLAASVRGSLLSAAVAASSMVIVAASITTP